MDSSTEIGAYDAKTRLPELLRNVQSGQRFTITHRGEPVADLVPVGASEKDTAKLAAAKMKTFMESHVAIPGVDIKSLVEEGRD
ncbi:MAG: type II toxin-antitoxin system prevent-host-death family antitoxin [Pseudomonadota bacterium]|nr:type II toxin-antitoxin system prevent-host-death family antitoxin [Pseudomonadota bacterium]